MQTDWLHLVNMIELALPSAHPLGGLTDCPAVSTSVPRQLSAHYSPVISNAEVACATPHRSSVRSSEL